MSDFTSGSGEEIPVRLQAARDSMEKHLFFEKFSDFVEAKLRVRDSREMKYGRENIAGVGIGWKNWPEGARLTEEEYTSLWRRYFGGRRGMSLHSNPKAWLHFAHDALHRKLKLSKNFGCWCIQVLVNRKVPEKLVDPDVLVSAVMRESGLHVLTDVVEVGEVILAANNIMYRPVTCGVSGGHGLARSGGTLGCVVKKIKDGRSLLLSCNHIVADTNKAVRRKDPVIQPSNEDRGTIAHKIGVLDDYVDLDFSGNINYVDAALVDIDPGVQVDPSMEGAGFVPSDHVLPRLGQFVKKVGRTTGLTMGFVSGIQLGLQGVPVDIPYGGRCAKFSDIFVVSPFYESGDFRWPFFALKGDSGSLIVENETGDNHAVGLLFSISEPRGVGFGCTFARIESALSVKL